MATLHHSQCTACAHLDRSEASDEHTCSAFAEGIPQEIWTNQHDHHDPYPGDSGIRFELAAISQKKPSKQGAKVS